MKNKTKFHIPRLLVAIAILLVAGALFVFSTHRAQADCTAPNPSYGTDTLTVNTPSGVTTTQKYVLWTRLKVPNAGGTVQASVDGGTCYNIGGSSSIPANSWTWVNYTNGQISSPISLSLAPGSHSIKYYGTSANSGIDKILLLTDAACVPSGDGSNCETAAPAVTVNASPNSVTQGSTVSVSANVSGTSHVSSVSFYDGFAPIGTSSSGSPYKLNWSTTSSTSVGSHTITAIVTNTDGSTESANTNVMVNAATSTQTLPLAPTGLKAVANSPTSVQLSWNDAVYVPGTPGYAAYYVLRNGVNITPSGIGATSYTDNSVVAGTNYTYTLETLDYSGAISIPSSAATVTTPKPAPITVPPTAPVLSGTAVSSSQINLSWKPSTSSIGIKGYGVWKNGNGIAILGPSTNPTLGVTGLSPSTTYSFYVIGVDNAGTFSQKSNVISVTTKPANNPFSAGMVTIEGVVTNANNNTPIYGAHVYTGPYATPFGTERTYTNSHGQYVLVLLTPNQLHYYGYHARGYHSTAQLWKLGAGTYTKNVKLSPY